jgi:hypothetical protein
VPWHFDVPTVSSGTWKHQEFAAEPDGSAPAAHGIHSPSRSGLIDVEALGGIVVVRGSPFIPKQNLTLVPRGTIVDGNDCDDTVSECVVEILEVSVLLGVGGDWLEFGCGLESESASESLEEFFTLGVQNESRPTISTAAEKSSDDPC